MIFTTRRYLMMVSTILTLTSSLVSCASRESGSRTYETIIAETNPYCFHLDDSTSQIANYIQLIDEGDSLRMMYLNLPARSLNFFNFSDFEERDKIYLDSQGPEAVDLLNSGGVFYRTSDSIFVYDYWTKVFSVTNSEGKVIQKIPTNDFVHLVGNPPQLKATSLSPLTMIGDRILIGGHPSYATSDVSNPAAIQTMTLVDTVRKTLTSFAEYPVEYKNVSSKNWNPFLYLVPDFCVADNKVVVSFPASDSIRVYDLETLGCSSYFAGSDRSFEIKEAGDASHPDHLYGGYAYKGIKYDRWNDVYYRVLIRPALPETKIDDYQGVNVPRPISIILLDHDFNKIAENDFDDYHGSFLHMFVSPRGLSIHSYSDDDDYLKFRTFTPGKL